MVFPAKWEPSTNFLKYLTVLFTNYGRNHGYEFKQKMHGFLDWPLCCLAFPDRGDAAHRASCISSARIL